MAGLGRRYHPFTAKSTLMIFGLLMLSGFGSAYLPIPYLSLFVVPAAIFHGLIMGLLSISLPGIAQTATLVASYYLFSVILGYMVHSFLGNSSSI